MANYETTEDVVKSVLHRCGELTDGTSDYNDKALEYVNSIYQSILAGGNEFDVSLGQAWPWAKSKNPGVLILKAPVTTYNLTVTNGSTSATLSAAPTVSYLGWYAKLSGRPEFFRISAHSANSTSVTLDSQYTESSGNISVTLYKLDYDLISGVLRLIAPFKVYRNQSMEGDEEGKIYGLDLSELERQYPLHLLTSRVPTYFAEKYRTTGGTLTVRFNSVVSSDTKVEYDYIPVPDDLTNSAGSIPLLPREFRVALDYGASYYLMTDKNDERAKNYFALAQAKMKALVAASNKEKINTSRTFGRLIPRIDLTWINKKKYNQDVD